MTLKQFALSALFACTASVASAQNNATDSPYSSYGFGLLNDRHSASATGMAGAGVAMRGAGIANTLNPASYSGADSLNMLFDLGLSYQNANLDANGIKKNAGNTSVDYITLSFRALKGLGISLGARPYSTIGYQLTQTQRHTTSMGEVTQSDAFSGSGGLHEAYLGVGWEVLKGFSIGANVGYLWGDLMHKVNISFSDANLSARNRLFESDIRTYKADFGVQYEFPLNAKNSLSLGAVYGLGHQINRNATFVDQKDTLTAENAYGLPHTVTAGAVWTFNKRLRVAADYTWQQWSKVKTPLLTRHSTTGDYAYVAAEGLFTDRQKIAVGMEYVPNSSGYKWAGHVRYRAGFSHASSYTKINGLEGPSNYLASVGVGLPIVSPAHSDRPIYLNLGVQYERVQPKVTGMIKENYLRFSVGVTFNEQWFAQWKAQ